jgi:hypothetical protein
MTRATLKPYLKNIRALQWAILVLPIGSAMLSSKTPLFGPPLGRLSLMVVPFGIAAGGIGMVLPLMAKNLKAARRTAWASAVVFLLSLLIYAYFVQRFVVTINISSQDRSVYVCVGTDMSEPYKEIYAGQRNSYIVKDQGYREEDIERVWTPSSLILARMLGLCSYIFLLASINTCIGAIARTQTQT